MRTSIELFKDLELRGILVAPKGWKIPSFDKRIEVFKAGHPSPNRDGLEASKRVMEAATKLRENDLLVCLISGGASALLPSPAGDISLQDKKRLTEQLIRSRVSIHEINTVRRHLSNLKGGRLVQLCRSSTILSLLISDVPGNHLPDIASGLTVEDPTTYSDAIEILRLHRLWDTIPNNVRNHLLKGFHGEISETPKPSDPDFRRVHNVIIADNRAACLAAKEAMKALGVSATILTSSAEMESHSMGRLLASIVSETKMHAEHMSRSSGIILGGETNLERIGKGIGGRNQETILSAVELIGGLRGVAIAAFGTDGVDGNSKAAGAIIDGNTAQRARRKLMEPKEYLARNDSNRFFRRLNDSLITGPTGTNVGDLYLMVSR